MAEQRWIFKQPEKMDPICRGTGQLKGMRRFYVAVRTGGAQYTDSRSSHEIQFDFLLKWTFSVFSVAERVLPPIAGDFTRSASDCCEFLRFAVLDSTSETCNN